MRWARHNNSSGTVEIRKYMPNFVIVAEPGVDVARMLLGLTHGLHVVCNVEEDMTDS